ncbi:hypothetical protein CEP52_004247 [Fusarium oligoseptatum]|uniref:Uncharacterized protein n=1 Tax=Fusarium oligoseptatum TaxID=2604345 RepID=A0A428U4E4_9HYPO|nr:hypothetical protein CEP52_004247 [Fusarium oligoseptatum]
MQLSGSVFDNFVRSFWSSLAKETSALRQLLLKQNDMDDYFGGPRLRDNINSILSAVTPEVREVLNDGQFSLQNLLDLSHVHPHMTLPGPCVYLRIYTGLEGQPAESHDDATETGINHGVAFYIGKAKEIWRRARQHETNTGNLNVSGLHYSTARRSPPQHRHMIPVIIFEQAIVPEAVMNMAEQTMVVAFQSYQGWLFRPVQSDNVFDGVAFTFGKDFAAQGPKPTDAKRGYLVFKIMDDKKPHPRAWIGVPSVGPFKNFDQASSGTMKGEQRGIRSLFSEFHSYESPW